MIQVLGYRVLMRSVYARAESQIPNLLHRYGPLAVGIDSSSVMLDTYDGGVFPGSACTKDVDHAVTIVGYTDEYWIIKNSWGPHWGIGGYLHLERGVNACGIAEYIVYVTDARVPSVPMSTSWRYNTVHFGSKETT